MVHAGAAYHLCRTADTAETPLQELLPIQRHGKTSEQIYPLFDEYDDLIALSIQYSRNEDGVWIEYFETYTADTHIRWRNTAGNPEEELRETYETGKIPAIYHHRSEPIWEDQSPNVYEVEWALSRNGNSTISAMTSQAIIPQISTSKDGIPNVGASPTPSPPPERKSRNTIDASEQART